MSSTLIGNGLVGQRENGIVVNGENWNSAMPPESFSQGNGNGTSCWTPGKPVRSNPQNQVETENWEDLVEIYRDLLKEETLNLNKVAQNHYPTKPQSTVENIGNQNQVAILDRRGRPPLYHKKNQVNRNLNSTHIPNLNHNSHQASTSFAYFFPSEDPANWDSSSLLAAIVRPKKSSASLSIAQNKSLHALRRTPVPNPSTQVGSNSIGGVGSIVGIGNQQSHTFTSNKLIGGYNSKQLPTDGFPVPYHHQPCYNLNSPPRSEQDAASSGDSTSSTTQKEHQVPEEEEEGDELDLNKTPQPARRKKHRPIVIREGKPKKTPKNTPPSNETTRVKRKYVRKKKKKGIEF